jgi:type I restriction enzyme S subunit
VDACRERLDRVPAILKRFRQSVLAAATSGELTREWREERGRPPKWNRASFGVTGEVTGGITKNSGRANTSLRCRYLRVANVYANNLKLDEIAEIATTPDEFARTRLQSGDVLIVEGNGSIEQIGRAALWRGEIHECAHQNHIIRWRTRGSVMPEYALHWLLSPTGRDSLIQSATSSAGLHTLSLSKIRSVPISVPPIDEQCEIVKRVEHLLASARLMEQRFAEARACLAQTVPATLAKAFRGDLVPQDPNDEPAAALLARIAGARQTAPKGSGTLPGRRRGGRHAHAG